MESAHRITEGIQEALAAAGRGAFRVYLESKEELQDVVVIGGESFRFKYTSEKRFETLWGVMGVRRRVYQNASDTGSHVALDAAWGMAGQFMTIEVREAVAFSCAHVTPEETHELLKKSALFHPHPTQMKRCVEEIGTQVGVDPLALDARVRSEERAPEDACVLAASLDGANVLLNEPADGGRNEGVPPNGPARANPKPPAPPTATPWSAASHFTGRSPRVKRPRNGWHAGTRPTCPKTTP